MEKITTKRTIIKTIEEELEMDIFVSKDGTIFDIEEECLKNDDNIDFKLYFEDEYKLKTIDPFEYGLNFGHPTFCHLVKVEKINDTVVDDFVRYYDLEDHPYDIVKIKEGWSFVTLVSDVNLWIFDKTDRLFIIESLDDIIEKKKNELDLLIKLI